MLNNSITDHLRWAATNVITLVEDVQESWLVAAKLQGMFSEASYKSTEYQSQSMG
jgi:hypothetical protein